MKLMSNLAWFYVTTASGRFKTSPMFNLYLMPKHILNLVLFLLLLSFSSAAAQIDGNWKTLDKPNYSIQNPANWQTDDSGQLGTDLFLFSPLSAKSDQFRENVNLVSQSVAELGVDLKGYVELNFGQLRLLATNFHVIASDKIKEGRNGEYFRLEYQMDQDQFHLHLVQYYWVIKGYAYVLTLTCEESEFEKYAPTGNKVLNSFTIK